MEFPPLVKALSFCSRCRQLQEVTTGQNTYAQDIHLEHYTHIYGSRKRLKIQSQRLKEPKDQEVFFETVPSYYYEWGSYTHEISTIWLPNQDLDNTSWHSNMEGESVMGLYLRQSATTQLIHVERELVFPWEELPIWLFNTRWSALKIIHKSNTK